MSNSLKTSAFALVLAFATAFSSKLAFADGVGLMLGAGGYYSEVNSGIRIDDIEDIDDINFDDSSFAYNLDIGWRFNKWIAIDGGYWDLGEFKSDFEGFDRKQSFDTQALTLGGIVSVPLWVLDLYGRGGFAYWEFDGRNIDEDGTDPYYGLGVALNLGGSLDIYLEWVRFDFETELDTAGLGVRWTF